MNNRTEKPRPSGVSRRTVVKGAAWAVPAITVASAVPAYAKSGGPPKITVLEACKQPGASCFKDYGFRKGYTFTVMLENTTGETIYLYSSTSITPGPYFSVTSSVPFTYSSARYFSFGPPTILGPVGDAIELLPGQTKYIIINAGTNSNSANTDAIGTLWFPWGHTTPAGSDTDHPYTPAPGVDSPPFGEGWVGDGFSFASTPPCTDCLPGGV